VSSVVDKLLQAIEARAAAEETGNQDAVRRWDVEIERLREQLARSADD
jgi:hypothetical protein